MDTKVEGIIISKTPYRDRDCIASLLLRSGEKITVLFYGGMGGGKKNKSSLIELGFLLNVELKGNVKEQDMQVAQEWNLKWFYKNIRLNHKLYYQLTFFCELISKISSNDDSIFTILSNAIFRLEMQSEKGDHTLIFLSKLIIVLGVFPEFNTCSLCGLGLDNLEFELRSDHGGFCCQNCVEAKISNFTSHKAIRELLLQVAQTKYQDISLNIRDGGGAILLILLNYLCFHFGLRQMDFKSLSLVL